MAGAPLPRYYFTQHLAKDAAMRLVVDLECRDEWYFYCPVFDVDGRPTVMTAVVEAVYAEGAD